MLIDHVFATEQSRSSPTIAHEAEPGALLADIMMDDASTGVDGAAIRSMVRPL
jgi:hypothetical protein